MNVFDEDYDGPRFRYGLTHRPVAIGAVSLGWIIGSNKLRIFQFRNDRISS